jgi:hypothetical protein
MVSCSVSLRSAGFFFILTQAHWANGISGQAHRNLQRLQPLLDFRHNPIRQQNDEKHILDWSFNRVRKANKPERNRRCPKLLRFECADLDVIKSRHKIGSDLCDFLSGHGLCDLLLIDLEKRTQPPCQSPAPALRLELPRPSVKPLNLVRITLFQCKQPSSGEAACRW